jgi:hypothetical protein
MMLWFSLQPPSSAALIIKLSAVPQGLPLRGVRKGRWLELRVNNWQQMAVPFVAMAVSDEYDCTK